MALVSPGVEVSIIDQSQYLPAASNSVPLVVIATAQNKANAAGTAIAAATTAANAGKLYQVTSQRDLVNLYGNPFFYKTTIGTPIQGYELNEYGLLAAYSLLGVTNRCYVLRADVDLASLVGKVGRPSGNPTAGTWWLDATTSTWGINQFNASTGKFTTQTPFVITDLVNLVGGTVSGAPVDSLGNIGDYAVVAIEQTGLPGTNNTFFYKDVTNSWVRLGSREWKLDLTTVQGTVSNPTLTATDEIDINVNDEYAFTVEVPSAFVADLADAINGFGFGDIYASVSSGKLVIASGQDGVNKFIELTNNTGTPLEDLGISEGTYYQPDLVFGTSAQMPLWTASQSMPHPTGSVWIRTQSTTGLNPIMSVYSTATASYVATSVSQSTSDWAVNAALDSTGGAAIAANSVYAQYSFDGQQTNAPIYFWKRIANGPTVVTGTVVEPEFTSGYTFTAQVSVPGSNTLSSEYTVTINGTDATAFVTGWSAANIPNTTATVTTTGAIQLTHTKGGVIVLDDHVGALVGDPASFVSYASNGVLAAAGFEATVTAGVKTGPFYSYTNETATQDGGDTIGTDALFSITAVGTTYVINSASGGAGYQIGDTILINGSQLGGQDGANDLTLVVTSLSGSSITSVGYGSGVAAPVYKTQLSNWRYFDFTANEGAPKISPANNTPWFYSVTNEVDIMVNKNGDWYGYRNVAFDSTGHPAATGTPSTDPAGPIISASEPTVQSDGTALVYGDLWINTSDLENYPVINRWQNLNGMDQWVLIDNTDQRSSSGVVFADARWAPNGTTDTIDDPIPTIKSLLSSDYLDLDAPNPVDYPQGMLLFNTRRSGYNVKEFRTNYFNGNDYPDSVLPAVKDTWVTASGLQANGAPYMGRKAQRNMVVQALKAAVSTNMTIREEDTFFNLMATPNYAELQPEMITLNNDRNNTAYIVGDTPMRLDDQATSITNWATNAAGATATGEEGLVTRDSYMGLYYPSGITTNPTDGTSVAVPPSHMMLRTFLRNDSIAYPWLAAAGTRRGTIDNATNIGYVDATTGEFVTVKNRIGIRDVLYVNQINPLTFFTGVGLLNYGNKNSYNSQSALDRTNVARLVAYIRDRLQVAARPFVFEPNDSLTRQQITGVIQSLFIDLVAKRGIYDYSVVCDSSNNTPARIDRNELWVDIAIEPVKAVEFIYIPVRILNTGALAAV